MTSEKTLKRPDTSIVITVSLPRSLLEALPIKARGRSKYFQHLVRQDVARRSRMPQDARPPSVDGTGTGNGVRTLEARLNAIRELEAKLRETAMELSTQLADLDASLRRTRDPGLVTRGIQSAPGVAQSADPFAVLPDPDRPGRVRLKTNQDGSTHFEVVPLDGSAALPAPQPMTRTGLPKTRPGNL